MSFLQHKQQKNFSNWSFKYTPKNDYITTPLCCLAYTSPSVQTFRPSELKIMAKLLLHWSTQQIKVTEKYPGYITSHGLAGLHRTDKYFNYPGGPSRYWEETGKPVFQTTEGPWGPPSSHSLLLLGRGRDRKCSLLPFIPAVSRRPPSLQVHSPEATRLQRQLRNLIWCLWMFRRHYKVFLL